MSHDIVIFMPIKINSRRVRNKSIKEFCNRPLLCWSLEKIDQLGVPTFIYSSSCDIIKNLIDFDVKNIIFLNRSKLLDRDDAIGMDIYNSFREEVVSDSYILTHCTSPFVHKSTYSQAIELLADAEVSSVFTAKEERAFCWLAGKKINFSLPRQKTQDLEPVMIETSGIYGYKNYVLDSGSRTSERNFKLIRLSALESIDIDTADDFVFAERVARSIIEDGGAL